MRALRIQMAFVFGGMLLAIVAWGCAVPPHKHAHSQVETPAPRQFTCQSCYDEAVKVRTGPPRHRYYKTIIKHHCSECRGDMEVYEDGGKSMIKCASCAPGGLPCDQCLPPEGTKR